MNVAHPDDNEEEIADVEGTQESDNSDQQTESAKSEAPRTVRSATNPIIINKGQ